jgi:hypothetical protein
MYRDLPVEHYRKIAQYRDLVASCLVIDPSVVNGFHVAQVDAEACNGHVLGDLLAICRVYRSNPTEVMLSMIERHELLRLAQIANAGEAWRWYSEFYAMNLNRLQRLETVYYTLAHLGK